MHMDERSGEVGRVFWYSRYAVLIAVIGLLVGGIATLVFGGIMSVGIVGEAFRHTEYNSESARLFSTEIIELIDLFLLGTVLMITSIGLFQLFIDPDIRLPDWLSVTNLDQLKADLVAVIIVMLTVMFLGEAATMWDSSFEFLAYGASIALVILAISVASYLFQRIEQHRHEMRHAPGSEHAVRRNTRQEQTGRPLYA